MILYFTGTGNSKYIASLIAKKTQDNLISLNDLFKTNAQLEVEEDVVLVVPTYAWRIPKKVSDYILKLNIKPGIKIWFVLTCGGEIANASKYNMQLCDIKGLNYMGTYQIAMPDDYIVMFEPNTKEDCIKKIELAKAEIEKACDYLINKKEFPKNTNNLYYKFLSGPVNKLFYKIYIKTDDFISTDKCIGCGKCVEKCPLNNIKLVDGKPCWSKDCMHCMACISYCPTVAIEYGNHTKKRTRYTFESMKIER